MNLIIPNFWRKKGIISALLLPLAYLYNAISCYIRYKQRMNIYQPKAKVITIGNITMGGAGKTPVALSIYKILQNYTKYKVAVLIRGYRGNLAGPLMVNNSHKIDDVGDEALLLSDQVTTCISKDRLSGIKFLESQGYDVIITDDGMQDDRFLKALIIMVVDGYFGFGNGYIFPAGPLRENIASGIKKADLIAVIGEGELRLSDKIIHAKQVSKILRGERKYIAFAGIGNPEKFFRSVEEAEGVVVKKIAFGDHHQYTDKEINDLLELANKHQAMLITTEKDYTRIDEKFKNKIEVLSVVLVWEREEMLMERLLAL